MLAAVPRVAAATAAALLLGSSAGAAAPPLQLIPYATGFSAPIAFVQDPTDSHVQFVVEQAGRIRTVVSGVVQPTPFLDISSVVLSGGERGLLGLAFPPDAASSHRFYVYYTDGNGDSVVARYKRSANPRVADASTALALLWSTGARVIRQPFANHNGGCLMFGPDGFLYIGMGDGGSGDDPLDNAQSPGSLLGKMLRIDVSVSDGNTAGFVVPPSNPFVGVAGYRPEIWDVGLRNPWRYSFDDMGSAASGALIIGDVGQGRWEEIDYEPAGRGGRNYGWVLREGTHANVTSVLPAFTPLIDPVYEYDHSIGSAIIGGYVYRGAAMPSVAGRYFFADYVTARLFSAAVAIDPATHAATFSGIVDHTAQLNGAVPSASAMGRDAAGELYLVDYSNGRVLKLVQRPAPPTNLRIIR